MADIKRRAAVKQRRGTKRHHSQPRETSETLEVVCRIKKNTAAAAEPSPTPCVLAVDEELVQLIPPPPPSAGMHQRQGGGGGGLLQPLGGNGPVERIYRFGHVFDAADSQRAVFNRCALDLIEDLLRGKNSLLFAYGVGSTGAGLMS
jgi:hypothetical protein